MSARRFALPLLLALTLAACGREPTVEVQAPRQVRVVLVEALPQTSGSAFTGRIEARDQAALGFRIAGRVETRPVAVGDTVTAGQVIATLEPQDQENALRSARADLVAAQGRLVQAQNAYQRRAQLLRRDVISKAEYEVAEQGYRAARASVQAAEARLATAEETLGFTLLVADAPGVVTAVGLEPGEFARAGQLVVRLARRDGRDAVFDVPAAMLANVQLNERFTVALANDPAVMAEGRVREIAPQADPMTRTHQVRIGLDNPRPAFRLGATVTGRPTEPADGLLAIPASAVVPGTETAVWVVDPQALTVARRVIEIDSRGPAAVLVKNGLKAGEIVVTAGTGTLVEGQAVRLPEGQS